MASPFRVFRKNIKPLLAVFTALLIVAWLGGGALTGYMGNSRGGAPKASQEPGAIAVRWDGGKLTNQQVDELVMKRRMLNQFLQQVEILGAQNAIAAGVQPSPLRVQRLLGREKPEDGVEQSVVETRLFADAARQEGIRVSDATVLQYLDQLGRGNVTRLQMRDMLKSMQVRTGRLTIEDIVNALRDELLARHYIQSNQYAFHTVTPEERWNDWLRVNERVVIEAAAVPVESYLVDVKDPSEVELQEFFDKYKDREPQPEFVGTTELPSPTPGFRIPRKIDLQYVEASFDSFLAKAEEKVTDEEIAKYYDEHKDPLFIKADMGLMEDKGEKKDKEKSDGAPDAKGTDETKPKDDAAKPAEGESKSAPAADDAKKDEKPAATNDAKPPEKEGKSDAPAKDGKQSSMDSPTAKSPFRLTAFAQDAAKDDAAAKDAGKTDAGTAAETKGADAAAKPADAAPPSDGAPPTKEASPAAPGATAPPASPGTPAAPVVPPAPKKPPEFQPLEQVKDSIRSQIATQKAAEEMEKITTQIQGELDAAFSKYYNAVLTAQADKKDLPPTPASLTDLAPLAEKNGLKSGATGPMSLLQLRDTPVGKTVVVDAAQSLLTKLFATKELGLYEPVSTEDMQSNQFDQRVNRYVVMKKSDTPGRVPTFAEVHDEVLKAWKAQKAVELALKHAQELAKKVEEAKAPLQTYFTGDKEIKVARTDVFAELTGGDVGIVNGQLQRQPYRLSQPNGVVAPGPEFMKEVFKLKDGQVGAILNHDHTIAYIIRMVEHQPPVADLRSAYLSEANSWPGLQSMVQGHAQEVASNLAADVTQGVNLKWERKKDAEAEQERASSEENSGG